MSPSAACSSTTVTMAVNVRKKSNLWFLRISYMIIFGQLMMGFQEPLRTFEGQALRDSSD